MPSRDGFSGAWAAPAAHSSSHILLTSSKCDRARVSRLKGRMSPLFTSDTVPAARWPGAAKFQAMDEMWAYRLSWCLRGW